MNKKENKELRKKENKMFETKQQSARKTLEEIKESYKKGIEYYKEIEQHEN